MLFSSSVLATKRCSCCRGDKALLILLELKNNSHKKHQGLLRMGMVRRVELSKKSKRTDLCSFLKYRSVTWKTNFIALKAINDGCVNEKRKKKRANSTALTPAAFMTRFSSFPALLAHGGKWKVLFAFCKHHINPGFSLQVNLRVRELRQLLPALLLLLFL